tara:strand:- start:6944 stop:7588 length:645 start_codon:yes stop_codon:yes gene_type:complete
MKTNFYNANEAYEYFLDKIILEGVEYGDTKALFNVGFTISNPLANAITNKERAWKLSYANAEWKWYVSGDRNIKKLGEIYGKVPPIWQKMAFPDGNVNSNYGWQWRREDQLNRVVNLLKNKTSTRQAAITIYDGKEMLDYVWDTPCTYAIQFTILNNELNIAAVMRSNDLWYGFCNDQYCFSQLQKYVAERLNIEVGTYYHFAHNLHLYNNKIN